MSILQSAYNFLVPASGTTNIYAITNPIETFDSGQITSITGQPFCPSGVIIDNTANANAMVINIAPINFKITCPAGKQMGLSYPAVLGHTATFSAINGTCTVSFVDYPVIPYQF